MRLSILKNGDVSLTRLNQLEADALRSVLRHADPTGTPEAEQRLVPDLVREDDDAVTDPLEAISMQEDWEEYVVPGLQELFSNALSTVAEDLKHLGPGPGSSGPSAETFTTSGPPPVSLFRLVIQRHKVEDWYRAMNQARLVMAEKTLWIEESGRLHGPLMEQVHYEIYTFIQQWLVENVMSL